jgi:uncharacterized protein (DUF1810 family)
MSRTGPFDLERFVTAQSGVFDAALGELKAGRKRTHWMWFVFPQLKDLGRSPTAQFYGLSGLGEARAYLGHPVLGERLRTCAEAVTNTPAGSLHALFGSPDELKFVSSMTLFALAEGGEGGVFQRALERWTGGRRDEATLRLLKAAGEDD